MIASRRSRPPRRLSTQHADDGADQTADDVHEHIVGIAELEQAVAQAASDDKALDWSGTGLDPFCLPPCRRGWGTARGSYQRPWPIQAQYNRISVPTITADGVTLCRRLVAAPAREAAAKILSAWPPCVAA